VTVNEAFPAGVAVLRPPKLVGALPPLPAELEYRVVGRDLALVDLRANLVVDVLRRALPPRASSW
jgi:hypothetical protein